MSETSPELTQGATKLRAFLEARGLGSTAAARALKCTHPAVIEWLAGAKRPAFDARKAIAIWTDGAVSEDDWMRDSERERMAAIQPCSAPVDPLTTPDDTGTFPRVCDCEKAKSGTEG